MRALSAHAPLCQELLAVIGWGVTDTKICEEF